MCEIQNETERKISWISIVPNSFPINIRRVWGQNPSIGEGFEKFWRSLNRSDSKLKESLKST
jgi:hypothetical protein